MYEKEKIKIMNCKREDIDKLVNELEKLHKKLLRRKPSEDVKLIIKSIVDLQDSLKNNKYLCEIADLKFFN